ncbi:sigma-70 family RNA polymerase sigma factor [Psychrobacillus sp. PGGUH221]|uniref:RNA polymerase sigma factor n=1 Tax=Psychrobacillus sp. PGGUH221 TaxID=3020058 RepID=UPI0035C756A4
MNLQLEDFTDKLYRYCLTLTNNKWEAEDLVQETFIKCYKVSQRDSERDLNLSFLYKTARNHFIDSKRKKSAFLIDETEIFAGSYHIPEWDSLLEILFCKLPLRQAMLLTLKDVFQFSSKEIAQILRVSNESIKTSLHRIRLNLRETDNSSFINNSDSFVSIKKLSLAIKEEDPYRIFYYYRLLEAENFKVLSRRENNIRAFFLSDPDGNILQIGLE